MTDYHAIAEGLKLPCIPFDEMATLLGQFWLVEPIPDVPYHYTLTTCPEIGHDIYEVVLSGFVCKSMINPPKRFIAVCELLEGEMNLQVGEHHFRAWPGELPPMVFSNVAKDEIQTTNQKLEIPQTLVFTRKRLRNTKESTCNLLAPELCKSRVF